MIQYESKVEYVDHMGRDMTVVNAARVSFAKQVDILSDKDRGLIKYLAKHNHISPFFHPQVSLRITCPISVRNQLDKSRIGLAINEVSRRYVDTIPDVFFPSWRNRPEKSIKQGSGDPLEWCDKADAAYHHAIDCAIAAYKQLLEMNVAPEQARFVLPLGTMTEFIWTGSLAAFARVYLLRTAPEAQAESRDVAYKIGQVVCPLFPESWSALTQKDLSNDV
jgi:thymidylate synthase (FAD)